MAGKGKHWRPTMPHAAAMLGGPRHEVCAARAARGKREGRKEEERHIREGEEKLGRKERMTN